MIYSLAYVIAERYIPLVFVTGYGSEAIEDRFKSVPVLQKPVDKVALRRVLLAEDVNDLHLSRMRAAVANRSI